MLRYVCLVLPLSAASVMAQPQIGTCPVFPARNIWNVPVDKLPVHPASSLYIASEGASLPVHPDFGSAGTMPYSLVSGAAPAPIQFTGGDSDPGPYPIPAGAQVEAGADAHLIVIDQSTCKLYEVYGAQANGDGSWSGSTGAVFDLRQNTLRPDGWTSADGAGLPIFPGLVRYDEAASGQIRHALRMTVPVTNDSYVWPARHYASQKDGEQYPAMGQRFRLRAGYDISGFDPIVQTILQAMKTYGMMVADNGSAWYITGAPDARWNDMILAELKTVTGADLEAVDVSILQAAPNSALATFPNASQRVTVAFSPAPVFNLAAAPTQSMTLTGDVTASTILNPGNGETVSFLICQDSAGGHAFAWPANVLGGMQIGGQPGQCSAQTFVSDGKKLYATTPGMSTP